MSIALYNTTCICGHDLYEHGPRAIPATPAELRRVLERLNRISERMGIHNTSCMHTDHNQLCPCMTFEEL